MNGVIIKIQACMYAIQVSQVYTVYSEASSSTVGQSHCTTISHCFMEGMQTYNKIQISKR